MYSILSTMRWRKLLLKIRPYLQGTSPLLFYSSVSERLILAKKVGVRTVFLRGLFFGLIPLIVPRF